MAAHPPGRTTAHGYDWAHQQLRKHWAPIVATGRVVCWRCRTHIKPGQPWHLGHDDNDRRYYRGPEHQACNCGRQPGTRAPARALQFFRPTHGR